MLAVRDRYGWEAEHADGCVLAQYNGSGGETPSTEIRAGEVARFSLLPRFPNLVRHDVLLDRAVGERFVRRFGRGFHKRTETNLDEILALCKYRVEGTKVFRVHYSFGPVGEIVPEEGIPVSSVRTLSRPTSIEHALIALGLSMDSTVTQFLVALKCFDRGKGIEEQSRGCRKILAEYGGPTSLRELISNAGLSTRNSFGLLLNQLGFPKKETHSEYLQVVETNRYRLWVFSSTGRALVTHPLYEVYL